jgi:hypothetical protein
MTTQFFYSGRKNLVSIMKYRHRFAAGALLLGAVLLSASQVFPQEKKEAPSRDVKVVPSQTPDESKAPLPKIENPEFVITGHETIELPEAVKTDASDAQTFVPPLPTAGAKQSDLSRTALKPAVLAQPQAGMNGRIDGSFGNFVTPQLGAWFGKSFSQGSMAVNGRYASSDGYAPNTQWLTAGFGIAGSYKLDKSDEFFSESRWKSEFGLGTDTYRAYGSADPMQKRTLNDLDFALGFDSRYTWAHPSFGPIDYTARLSLNRTSLSDTSAAVENDIGLLVSASSLYESVPVNAAFEYHMENESMPVPGVQAMQWIAASGGAKIPLVENLQLALGASFTLYRGSIGPMSARLYPRLGIRWFAAQWLTLHAGFEPAVTRASFRALVRANKYILTASPLLPSDAPVAFTFGAECLPFERASISLNADYRTVNHYQSFIEALGSHAWTPLYVSDIRVMKLDLRGRYALSSLDAATGFVTFNSATHKDSSSMLPFIPAVNAGLIYRHWFQSDISTEISAEYVGRRFTDFTASSANAAYCVVGARAEYGLVRNLKLTANVQNLFNQNYYIWNGYRERPLFVSFGINYLW